MAACCKRANVSPAVIFQPAEEGGGGAREMIRDGLFDKFPVEAVFGMHNWPGPQVGKFAVSPGPVMASSNEFKVVIRGKGSHAALPHNGIDPVPVACQMVQAFQTIITRNKRPIDAGVISVTMIHTGEATNVVPESCEIQGTVRTFTLEVLDLIEERMKAVAEHTCAAFGASCEFEFHRNYPPTINHDAETDFARGVLSELVGADNVLEFEPTMGAEDFSFFLQKKPGAYFMIGNGQGEHREGGHGLTAGPCTLHNPHYDFNDEAIPYGVAYWVRLVERWLAEVANVRLHATLNERPVDRWRVELPALQPLPFPVIRGPAVKPPHSVPIESIQHPLSVYAALLGEVA